jgi:hypothetical protein
LHGEASVTTISKSMEIKIKNNTSITKNTYLLSAGLKMKAHMPSGSSSLLLAAPVHVPETWL